MFKLNELHNMLSQEITKLDKFCEKVKDNVEILIGFTRTVIEDIRTFNKDYSKGLTEKKEVDSQVFTKIKNSLTRF